MFHYKNGQPKCKKFNMETLASMNTKVDFFNSILMEFDIKVSIKWVIIMTARKITIMNLRKIIRRGAKPGF